MPDLWIPGSAEASVDALVAKLHHQIERFAADQPGKQAEVEIELQNGTTMPLESILPEPGYGFVTLRPHGADEELIVPVSTIARIRVAPSEQHAPFGFSGAAEA
jgi:hypothetical protein